MKIDLVDDAQSPSEERVIEGAPPSAGQYRLGEVLRMYDLITDQQLEDALAEGKRRGVRLGQVLVEMKVLVQDQINWALAHHLGIPYLSLSKETVDPALVGRFPRDLLRQLGMVPLVLVENELAVAMWDPTDHQAVETMRQMVGLPVKVSIASRASIEEVLNHWLARPSPGSRPVDLASPPGGELDRHLEQALARDADAVCFQPGAEDVRITYRAGADVLAVSQEARTVYLRLASQIAEWAGQRGEGKGLHDAFLERTVAGRSLRAQLLVLPTVHGETLTVRIYREVPPPDPAALRLGHERLARVRLCLSRPAGLAAVVGQDRRANVELLYALLQLVPSFSSRRIVTLEHVNQIRLPEAHQISLDRLPGSSLAELTSRALTHQPDVILVDSITGLDPELISLLVRSALCHTLVLVGAELPDTADGLALLREQCHPPSLLAAGLLFIVAHSTLRRLCTSCAQPLPAGDPGSRALRKLTLLDLGADAVVYRAGGCPECRETGFAGELSLNAFLDNGPTLRRALLGAAPLRVLQEIVAATEGTLQKRVSKLVADGVVSLEEVFLRVGLLRAPGSAQGA
jgi:type II secretory ATPase GspE/PulE/Tfp pilus assembly ATPase PilB-like protein